MGYIQKIVTSFFLFLALFLSLSGQANAQWVTMDGTPGSENVSQHQANDTYPGNSMSVSDENGFPYVVWNESQNSEGPIYLTRWNGSAWVDMSGNPGSEDVSQNGDYNYTSQVVLDLDGRPIVSWADNDDGQIYLTRWSGSAWVDMSGNPGSENVSQSGSPVYDNRLVLDSDGNPIIIWTDNNNGQIYLTRWNGSAWVDMSGNPGSENVSQSGDYSQDPFLVLDSNDRPYVAWSEYNGVDAELIRMTHWNGSTWVDMSGNPGSEELPQDTYYNYEPKIAFDSNEHPFVEWSSDDDGQIYLTRWNGSTWVDMSGNPGSENVSQNSDYNYNNNIALDSSDGPIVSWADDDDGQVYLTRWNGSAWVDMSGNPGSENVSQTSNYAYYLSMVLDSRENLFLTWTDNGDRQIYLTHQPLSVQATDFSPSDNTTNISTTPTFSITFDQSVQQGSGNITIKKTSDNFTFETIAISSSQITGWGTNTLTFSLSSSLAYNTEYAVDIDAGAIQGTDETEFQGITDLTTWNFTTRPGATIFTFEDSFDTTSSIDTNNTTADVDTNTGTVTLFDKGWTYADGVTEGSESVPTSPNTSNIHFDHDYWDGDTYMILDATNHPVFLWVDTASHDLFITRWNGSEWTQMDGTTPGYENVTNTGEVYQFIGEMVADASGNPMIVWADSTPVHTEIYFTRWNGSEWTKMDGATSG